MLVALGRSLGLTSGRDHFDLSDHASLVCPAIRQAKSKPWPLIIRAVLSGSGTSAAANAEGLRLRVKSDVKVLGGIIIIIMRNIRTDL